MSSSSTTNARAIASPRTGKERALTIPLSSECVKILARRRLENRVAFKEGDRGWVFPTRAIKSKPCALCAALGKRAHEGGAPVHLVEGKQQRFDKEKGKSMRILPSPHRLRDTYTSALVEVGGVSPFVIVQRYDSDGAYAWNTACVPRRARA